MAVRSSWRITGALFAVVTAAAGLLLQLLLGC